MSKNEASVTVLCQKNSDGAVLYRSFLHGYDISTESLHLIEWHLDEELRIEN
jgi:hypothetical protein